VSVSRVKEPDVFRGLENMAAQFNIYPSIKVTPKKWPGPANSQAIQQHWKSGQRSSSWPFFPRRKKPLIRQQLQTQHHEQGKSLRKRKLQKQGK
jgi:hypothetical protein